MVPGWGWFQIPAIQPLEQSQPKGSSLRMGRQCGWAEAHPVEERVSSCEGGNGPIRGCCAAPVPTLSTGSIRDSSQTFASCQPVAA